jgi:hypothetical protein
MKMDEDIVCKSPNVKTIIKYQLMYFLKDQYSKNLTEVTSAKNAEGLSGMDEPHLVHVKLL